MNTFGWCCGIEDGLLLQEAGFDYVECPLINLKLEEPEEHNKIMDKYVNSLIPVKAFNIFFPGDMKLTGPDVEEARLKTYIAKAAQAMNRIGTEIAVLGSGRSRSVPIGWEKEKAQNQMVSLLEWIADEFSGTGITLVIEPLNRKESNIINSVDEAVHMAKLVNRDQIRVLADFYHMDEENEPLHTLEVNKDWLAHIHIADTERRSPGTGKYPYDEFIKHLRNIQYEGMISTECNVIDFQSEIKSSYHFLKNKLI